MVKVLKTNAGFFLAFKDDVTLSDAEILQYKKSAFVKDEQEFSKQFPKADFRLTDMLQKELPTKTPQLEYFNQLADMQELKEDIYKMENQTHRHAWFCKYNIAQQELPPPFDKQNTSIRRVVSFYYPEYDEQTQETVCYNAKHDKVNITDIKGFHLENEVSVYDKVFLLPQEFIDVIRSKDTSPKGKKIISFLSNIVSEHLNKDEKFYMLCHELKHAQSYLYKNQFSNNLTPKQKYCYNEDNEKSAYLQEIFTLCASYFQKGEDLSVFPCRYYWLKKKIKDLTPEQRKQVLINTDFIVNESLKFWEETASPCYKEKINGKNHLERLTLNQAKQEPVLNIDTSDETYLKCKENMFTFTIYNPDKKAYETTNVLPLIKNPTQLPKAVESTITEAENIIKERQRELQKEGITKELITSLLVGSYKEPFQLSPLYFAKLQKGNYEK